MVKVRQVGKYVATQKTGKKPCHGEMEKPIKTTNWSRRRDRSVPNMEPAVHPNSW